MGVLGNLVKMVVGADEEKPALTAAQIEWMRRRQRRRYIKSKQRRRWPSVKFSARMPARKHVEKEALKAARENGLLIRAFERVGKPRSKYYPDECNRMGKR